MAKPTKYIYEYIVQGNYGYGWNDLTCFSRAGRKEARAERKVYDENEPQYPHRVIFRRTLRV